MNTKKLRQKSQAAEIKKRLAEIKKDLKTRKDYGKED